MKTHHRIPLAILAASALLGSSCVSFREQQLREFDRAALAGMVYDWEQKPCAGAEILVDGGGGPRTDLNGRFVIGDLARGGHVVRVVKDGYEPLETRIEFLDRSQILYLRVASHAQLVREAEEALARHEMGEADALLARAEAVDPEDPVGRFLRAQYLTRAGDADGAVRLLDRILASGLREPAVYLSLADIYEYRIGDRERAAGYLRDYLALVNSPDVRARLEGLKP